MSECIGIPYKIKAQVEDSALSVPSNIAEGYSRRSIKENIQFNTISLSSLAENYTQIYALFSSVDIDKNWFDEYDKRHYKLENKLIMMNRRLVEKLKQNPEWKSDYLVREIVESYESN